MTIRRLMGLLILVGCASGTGHDEHQPSPSPTPTPSPDEQAWDCEIDDGATQCTALTGEESHESYTCSAGDDRCPPTGDAWACIAEHETVTCREVVPDESMAAMRPADCAIADWKVFFCQIAQLEIDDAGFDHTFDCGLLQDQLQLQPLPSPNCDEVVNPLELKSWTEAAYAGCSGALSEEITAWCYNTNLMLSQAGVCAP